MSIYLVAFLVYGVICVQLVGYLAWPWWSTLPMALFGIGVLILLARHRARARR